MAALTQPSSVDMTTEAMLGSISPTMIRTGRSPLTTAASTKSVPHRLMAWARRTRAAPAQPVTTRTMRVLPHPGGM